MRGGVPSHRHTSTCQAESDAGVIQWRGSIALVPLLLGACLTFSIWQGATLTAKAQGAQRLRGRVTLLDGTPVAEATVRASAICNERNSGDVHIVRTQETRTEKDGTFSFPVFDPDCNRYSFRASKLEDYWLPSDEAVFSDTPPSAPAVNLSATTPAQAVQIVLRVRGGKVAFRVWDLATGRFVNASLELRRKSHGNKYGSILLATGMDGSAATLLVPPGEYTAQLESYPCGNDQYFTLEGPVRSFFVKPGIQMEETIRMNSSNLNSELLFGRRRPQSCSP